ncbi:copper chaperone PCu(A)C [Pseudoalteromonas sp. SSDWG2]|uniref:copper chaperone PCu(A)C n=1 Tax=Pseudoalteromonas sp. SSDWG2 TaxID=3139391 RepID=UPI003BAA2AEE
MRITSQVLLFTATFIICIFNIAHAQIMVSDAKIRQFLPATKSTVGYLTIMNHSDQERVLTGVESSSFGRVEIHTHDMHQGLMKMRKLEQLTLVAHDTKVFEPGGLHLMVFEPSQPLKVGTDITITLVFANGERVTTHAQVYSLLDEKPSNEDVHQHHHN